ncbi:hypothetical protein SASPL_129774 [Salvia splendens]|uniref:Uncharacterized protein n=1 Tax=Salvia splendens TaxID=180675 RepID=A0A8X8XBX4_SALSN|nr:hypothetical protein SASPL_129774 [Salvia splendens]
MLVATTMGHVKIDQMAEIMNSKNMTLKVMLQKSTNKFLFVQADSDFIDFLFSILILSLERLGSTGMSRFHMSATLNFENMHLKPYKSFLTEYNYTNCEYYGWYDYVKRSTYTGRYVKGSMMYMVRDDLTVSPLEVTSVTSGFKHTESGSYIYDCSDRFFKKQEKDIKPVVKQEME